MRKFLAPVAAAVALTFMVACGDQNRGITDPPASPTPPTALAAPTPGTCITLSALIDLAEDVFGAGSPNLNSVVGKLNNLQHQINLGNFSTAKEKAYDIVDFVLGKFNEGGLPGASADLVSFINGVFCFAGLPFTITDPGSSYLVYPLDSAQTLVSGNGLAGTQLPPDPVSEPTLITITVFPDTFTVPGAGPLDTKLDQYPGYVRFTKTSETNAPFKDSVVVAVCAKPGIPTAVRERLRLGHDASAGFEVTPAASGAFLQCPTEVAHRGVRGLFSRLAKLVGPRVLHARQESFFAGGVGGTAGEYSQFGPVDTEVGLSGGVGGTAGEYNRGASRLGASAMSAEVIPGSCPAVEAPIGSPLGADCLPLLTITTALGTVLQNVPVTWNVTAGGGQIAPRSGGVCGNFGGTAATATSALGKTGVCWTLGDAGTNSVTATPGIGGDVPVGTTFDPATVTFNATANPPVGVVFMQQPPLSVNAGAPFTVTALIVDKNGTQVMGSNAGVTVTPNQHSFAGAVPSVSVNAVQGLATFANLAITKAATGYTLTAASAVITVPNTPPVSNAFDVVPGAPTALTIVAGNNQTAASGTTLPINPTVRVADQYDNGVPGVVINWVPGLSSSGTIGTSPTTTGATGTTSTTWTIGDGANQLIASVNGNALLSAVFDATGTSTLGILNQCLPAAGGDPINDASKTYAFYMPNPGKNKTIRQISVYLSSSGKANAPTSYQVKLTTQMGTFDAAVSAPLPTTTTVALRGNNSEKKLTTFTLATPIVGAAGGPNVMVRLQVMTNPDNATINMNTGECPPGTSCKVPRGCSVTEVNSLTPFPAGTFYRKTVGLVVKGG